MSFQSVWLVVPTYNERANLAPLIQSIGDSVKQVLIVDDASPDGTAAAAREFPNVTVLERSGPRGYGHSMRDGLKLALRSGADAVVTMDADLSHDATIIPQMLAALSHADLVIGSRYCQSQSNVEGWSRRRLFISHVATALVRACTGAAVTDPTAGFRCWNVTLLRRLNLDQVECGGFAFLYELLFHAHRARARFHEVPNLYRGRIHGESKLNTRIIVEALRLLPRLLLRRLSGRP